MDRLAAEIAARAGSKSVAILSWYNAQALMGAIHFYLLAYSVLRRKRSPYAEPRNPDLPLLSLFITSKPCLLKG